MNSAERSGITIGGSATTELDISASFLSIFLILAGAEALPEGDLYEVGGLPREVVKAWCAQSFATGRVSAPEGARTRVAVLTDDESRTLDLSSTGTLGHGASTAVLRSALAAVNGWDEQLGGGIWWHQAHHDSSKNACSNGPAAVGYLRLAKLGPPGEAEAWTTAARKAVDWTRGRLQAADGLYDDRVIVPSGEVKQGKLTYNSALMLRAELELYRQTGKAERLEQAKRIGKAADWFADQRTGVYRDPLKWSQFMVEADLDLYRTTREEYLLRRARTNADAYFAAWQQRPPEDMMSNAGIARILWLLADGEADRAK